VSIASIEKLLRSSHHKHQTTQRQSPQRACPAAQVLLGGVSSLNILEHIGDQAKLVYAGRNDDAPAINHGAHKLCFYWRGDIRVEHGSRSDRDRLTGELPLLAD
jgi:hypothetical protein